jgi:hypothetical protein
MNKSKYIYDIRFYEFFAISEIEKVMLMTEDTFTCKSTISSSQPHPALPTVAHQNHHHPRIRMSGVWR